MAVRFASFTPCRRGSPPERHRPCAGEVPLVRRTPRAQPDKRSPSGTRLAVSPLLPHRANAISSPPARPYQRLRRSAPARSASPGRQPPTPAPSSRTSSAAAGTTRATMVPNGLGARLLKATGIDVGQWLPFPVGHSATRSRSARARTAGFRSLAGTRSTWCRGWPPVQPGPVPARAGPCPAARQRAGPRHCRAGPRREPRCRRPAGWSRHGPRPPQPGQEAGMRIRRMLFPGSC